MTDTDPPSEERYVPSASTVAFVGALCFNCPQLHPILAEHLRSNHGEVLPHILMWDISDWLIDRVARFGDADLESRAVLDFCDAALASTILNDDLDTLIGVAIVESLRQEGDAGRKVIAMFGPRLRAETERQDNWISGQS